MQETRSAGNPRGRIHRPEHWAARCRRAGRRRVVELHTGAYADADPDGRAIELDKIAEAARYGSSIGLTVHAGHGLHYRNVQAIAALPDISELNIGHSIVAQSVFVGLAQAVGDMKKAMLEARLR